MNLFALYFCVLVTNGILLVDGQPADHWYRVADQELDRTLRNYRVSGIGPAKNIIFFIGDGMGISTVTGARILKSQIENKLAGSDSLTMDRFPISGYIKTYSTDKMVADSASTATAYWTGSKTKQWHVGVDERFSVRNCTHPDSRLKSIAMHAIEAGKSVGLVTTTTVTHASPAPAYAFGTRSWETDRRLDSAARNAGCPDIARQLIENGIDFNVVLGGGLSYFTPEGRQDKRNLVEEWKAEQAKRNRKHRFVRTKAELEQADASNTDYLFGLFASGELAFEADRLGLLEVPGGAQPQSNLKVAPSSAASKKKKPSKRPKREAEAENGSAAKQSSSATTTTGSKNRSRSTADEAEAKKKHYSKEPSLRGMTKKAIEILSKNPNGFFLFVEGAKIDYGHHAGKAAYALLETLSFDQAIEQAVVQTKANSSNPNDTLIVVSADHSHTLTIGGNDPKRNHHLMDAFSDHLAADNMPYTILTYANGPGAAPAGQRRRNTTGYNTRLLDFNAPAAIPLQKETHGGEDVPLFAVGTHAFLFSGVHEQNYIPIAMQFAGCFGRKPNGTHCSSDGRQV